MTATLTPPPAAGSAPAPVGAEPAAKPGATGVSSDAARTMLALAATCLGIVPLASLMRESQWLFDAWLALLIVIGPAALLRLRWRASALHIWAGVVLLVPYLTLRFVHQHAIAGFIPGPGTWHDVHELLIRLHHTTASGVAPVHTTNAIRLVLCAILPLIAALIDLIAVVGRRGALAGIPLLVIYTISGAVPRHPVAWPLFIFAAIAFLILLSLDSRDDAQRWGHFVPRTGLVRRRAAGAISGQRIAAIAIVLAVLIPAFVQAKSANLLADAFHNGKKKDGAGNGLGAGGTGGIDPFVTLKGDLQRDAPIDLMTVHVQRLDTGTDNVQPFYARSNVLSDYTGASWVAASHGRLDSLLDTGFQSAPGTSYAPVTALFRAEVTINKLKSDPPVFLQPRGLDGDITSDTRWSSQDQLLIGGSTHSNEKYNVTFQQPDPSVDELNAANDVSPDMQSWLALPKVADSVKQLVQQLTAGASTQYQKALAIDHYFTDPANNFGYNLHVPPGKTGDPLVDFLTNRVGFCQQYAAAMGVMLRLANVPSRVVLGYAHTAPDSNGDFTITTNDAHAWVEAYFQGIGWVPFDPTPLTGITDGTKNDLPWAQHVHANTPTTSNSAGPTVTKPTKESSHPTHLGGGGGAHNSGISGAVPIVAGVVVLLLLVLATPWIQRAGRRRRRLGRARGGDADALWSELTDTATDLGYVWSDARSPRQVVDWLGPHSGSARPQLTALASAVEQARYAPPGTTSVDGPGLVADFDRLQTQLTAARETRQRLRARLFPPSLGWTNRAPRWMSKIPFLSAALQARKH